uniref:Zona-pellucida-binding protein 1/2 N-terminal domain-containing protein n=1 Tax=Laticauda laticaudata TaxID=8630 RepID=A0A8C5WQN4_LATLA
FCVQSNYSECEAILSSKKLAQSNLFHNQISSFTQRIGDFNVYVRVHKNSPYLVCMDLSLSQSEVIDPNYLWIGPDGQNLKRKQYVNLTETGKLMLVGFKEHMSGSYMCTLSYRVFRNDMQAEEERFKTYKFMIYAYRKPDYTYRISVHFTTKECKLAANKRFFEELQKILNNLVDNLKCHIVDSSYRCFSVKRPKHGLVDELFIVFQGNVKEWITLRNTMLTLEGHDLLLGWHAFLWYKGTKTQGYFRRHHIQESLWLDWEKIKRQCYLKIPVWLSTIEAFSYPITYKKEQTVRYWEILNEKGELKSMQKLEEQSIKMNWFSYAQIHSRYDKDFKTKGFYDKLTDLDKILTGTDEKVIKRLYEYLLEIKLEEEQNLHQVFVSSHSLVMCAAVMGRFSNVSIWRVNVVGAGSFRSGRGQQPSASA